MKRLFSSLTVGMLLTACTANQPLIDAGIEQPSAGKRAAMEWYAYHTGDDENGIPQNTLKLKDTTPQRNELYTTDCAGTTQVADIADLADSLAYIQCWWAGGGEQFAVYAGEAESIVIKHRTVDEETGYGEWETLQTL